MNYLKSITTSVLASSGVSFPFAIGERIPGLDASSSIWEIREGVKKDDGTPLTLFIYDSTLPALQPGNKDRRMLMQLARNALKKLRTIRHPDVVKYVDSVETDTHIYIATERVRPLEGVLRDWEIGGALSGSSTAKGKGKEDWIGWGVRSLSVAIAFLNSPPLSLHHSYLIPSAIFITPAMEWRLAGFDLLTTKDDASGVLWGLGGLAPGNVGERSGPEVRKGSWGVLRDTDPAQSDTYLLALLLFSLYNFQSPLPSLTSQPTPSSSGALPKSLYPLWKRMLNPNPRTRLSTTSFVSEAAATGFWTANPLSALVEGLDGFELRSEGEKLGLLRLIKETANSGSVPQPFLLYRVLPSLLHSLSLPTAPSSAMLPLVLELGKVVPSSDYGKLVLEPVIRLYSSPDRGTRMALLDGLAEYSDKLDSKTVVEKVWPHLITGFADTVPVIREATVKAVYPLASKLSDRILNNDLLRLLAKMQTDTEPSIRTNTCILLGRLAPSLGPNTKKKVLVPAFARSLKDPFVHARVAGLMALMATVECFDRDDLAGKVIPNMASAMVDKEKLVRTQAFKAMNMFLARITSMVEEMPETVLSQERVATTYGPITTTAITNGVGQAGLVNSAAGAAGALAGWAISSLGKQLASTEVHSSLSATSASSLGPPSIPSANASLASTPATSRRPSTDSSFVSAPSIASVSKPSNMASRKATIPAPAPIRSSSQPAGMKLSGSKAKSHAGTTLADAVVGEWEDADEVANAWGTNDLIDVNADDDDWAGFESAPVPEIVVPPPQSYYLPAFQTDDNASSSRPTPRQPASPPRKAAIPPTTARIPESMDSSKSSTASSASPNITKIEDWAEAEEIPPGVMSAAGETMQVGSLTGMGKEEKDKEMARRRDERKARIAAMKEQKKGKS
ncbi:MAG: hypothetical protein TREMPRED_000967 [Tremellales sp. Tagirdzhanova-0007]|nr:MAG: hypothetical protein TREMPRED_000967 [Tremellales sp. Tagirdzhanova-0007]